MITDKLQQIKALCKLYKVKSLYLFGSANTDFFNSKSDIDFLIAFDKSISIEEYTDNYFALQYGFRELLSRNIDLVTENSLSNPFFIKDVERTKRLIYGA